MPVRAACISTVAQVASDETIRRSSTSPSALGELLGRIDRLCVPHPCRTGAPTCGRASSPRPA
eukprot:116730-Prymnesium_polylepis.1